MIAICIGGPYDGVKLDHNDINLYTHFHLVGIRKFIFMPARSEWDSVRRGEKDKNEAFDGNGSIYELVRTTAGVELRYDDDGSVLRSATQEFQDGRQPIPVDLTKWEFYRCFRGEQVSPFPETAFSVTDEKDRQWKCIAVTKEAHEQLGGPMFTRQMVSLSVRNKVELAAKLSDDLD